MDGWRSIPVISILESEHQKIPPDPVAVLFSIFVSIMAIASDPKERDRRRREKKEDE